MSARQRAAIVLSFGAQAVLVAAALGVLVHVSAAHEASGAMPVASMPMQAPLAPSSGTIPVTVTTPDGQSSSASFPLGGSLPPITVAPGSDVAMTVDIRVPGDVSVSDFWLGLTDGPWTSGEPKATDMLLQPGSLGPGSYYSFTLHFRATGGQPWNRYLVMSGQVGIADSPSLATIAVFAES